MAHIFRSGVLGVASRRAHGTVRNLSALVALVAVFVLTGVSEAFVAPAGASAMSNVDGQLRGFAARTDTTCGTRDDGGRLSMSAGGSASQAEPKKLAAVVYTYVDGMEDKRGPYRTAHLDLLKTMTDEGTCLLGGAFIEPCDGAVILFSSPDQAQQFVDKDPYNTGGLVTKYQIRDYMAVVGSMLKN